MKKVISSLVLLALGVAAELTPLARFPGKNVLRQERCGPAPIAAINNKIYVFGGCYAIPYIVDPSDDFGGFSFSPNPKKTYNVSDKIYTYNMDTDEWQLEDDVTPYPFKTASTQTVGDAAYFFGTDFETDDTRSVDVWKYHSVEKTWDLVNYTPFVWHGSLIRTECDGKIYVTGGEDGFQVNIIHIYDTVSNTWLEPVVIDSHQLRIRKLICSADQVIQTLAVHIEKDPMTFFGAKDHEKKKIYSFTIHANGSAIQDDLVIEHYQLDRASTLGDDLYLLDVADQETHMYSINLRTNERRELGTINASVWRPFFIPYGDSLFLIGGSEMGGFSARSDKDKLKTFLHKFTVGSKFTVQN